MNVQATPTTLIRKATRYDAAAMAELINFAGEGLPLYLWTKMVEPGETAWDVGRKRAVREEGGFSYRNTVLLEAHGAVAAALIGYGLPDAPEPIDPDTMPAMFVPLQELENAAPGTWYVNVLAAFPKWRGQGFGSELLEIAERHGREAGKSGMSIIVSDANHGARRLYERVGYAFAGQRPMVKEAWDNAGENWVLLTKRF